MHMLGSFKLLQLRPNLIHGTAMLAFDMLIDIKLDYTSVVLQFLAKQEEFQLKWKVERN